MGNSKKMFDIENKFELKSLNQYLSYIHVKYGFEGATP